MLLANRVHFVVRKKMATLKKTMIVQLFLGVTRCSKCNSNSQTPL